MNSAAAGLSAPSFGAAQPYAPLPAYGAAPSYGPAPSYGTPSYGAPSYSSPIPLTPLITEEALLAENGGGGGGGGGAGVTSVTKIFGLPLKLLLPVCIILPIIAVVVVVAGGGGGGGGGGAGAGGLGGPGDKKPKPPCFKKNGDCKYENTTPYYEYENNTTEYSEYTEHPEYPDKQRRRRDADGASGLPAMSIAQVERLTQVVFSALRMQECQQRLLCELGTLSRSFSESTHSIAQAVEQFVPTSIKDSYDVFAKAENCEKYKCGSLEVKK